MEHLLVSDDISEDWVLGLTLKSLDTCQTFLMNSMACRSGIAAMLFYQQPICLAFYFLVLFTSLLVKPDTDQS